MDLYLKKKILINTYCFYPDINPRAFRAFELTKEFARQGHCVTVLMPESDFDYSELIKKYKFSIDFVEYKNSKKFASVSKAANKLTFFQKILRKILRTSFYCLFPSGRPFMFYFLAVYKSLKNKQEKYDMVISIAFPFDTHIGAAMAFGVNKQLTSAIKIADYGDPLYKNPALPNCPFYYWMDKFIAYRFDYISIPTKKALSIYTTFKKEEQIKVIPQGFDFNETKIAFYQKNSIPTFAYAGTFYEDIRNPTIFFDYLYKLHQNNIDFRFIVYTKIEYTSNMKFLHKYQPLLKEKLDIHSMIPREYAIYELSKMDFLINIENLSESQSPSKLIDYALTKRPVLSFNQLNFSEEKFIKFLNADYSLASEIDLDQFDIKKITNQFLSLV